MKRTKEHESVPATTASAFIGGSMFGFGICSVYNGGVGGSILIGLGLIVLVGNSFMSRVDPNPVPRVAMKDISSPSSIPDAEQEHSRSSAKKVVKAGYDPQRSKVSDDTMNDFIRGDLTGDLEDIPGIGPASAAKLAAGENENERVTNSYQLVGQFLKLKGPDTENKKVECSEHCQKFWHWLDSRGVTSHRSAVVKAIAEKTNAMIPGIYVESDLHAKSDDVVSDDDVVTNTGEENE